MNKFKKFYLNKIRIDKKEQYFKNEDYFNLLKNVPKNVFLNWKYNKCHEFHNLKKSYKNWHICLEGLFIYFKICSNSKKSTLLPSFGVDSIWHSWLITDQKGLQEFQEKFFGRIINHVEIDLMVKKNIDTNFAINDTFYISSQIENLSIFHHIDESNIQFPLIFKVDSILKFNEGFNFYYSEYGIRYFQFKENNRLIFNCTGLDLNCFIQNGYLINDNLKYNKIKELKNNNIYSSTFENNSQNNISLDDSISFTSSNSSSGFSCGSSCGSSCGGD